MSLNPIPPAIAGLLAASLLLAGCAGEEKTRERDFHTSGSREADQRAEQRIAREQQIYGKDKEKAEGEEARTLYERLGGERGVAAIVDDFVKRAMADPRVNWRREGVTTGGILRIRKRSAEWHATDADIARLKKHMTQFIALATGGPSRYQGQTLEDVHAGMNITNAEFEASIGDMKATLDALDIPTAEQKELLAILESTRPQIVEKR